MRTTIIGAAVLTALSGAGALAQSYDDLARQPSAYVGTVVNFKGKVVQALESENKYLLRVNVTKKPYNIWSDTVLVRFRASPSGGRMLEGDIINFRGRSAGIESYTAVLGQTIQLPSVVACEISDAASPFITVPGPCDADAEIKIPQMSRRSQDEDERRAKEAEERLKKNQTDVALKQLQTECKREKNPNGVSVHLRAAVLRGWAAGDVLTLRICGKNVKRKDGGIFMSFGGPVALI